MILNANWAYPTSIKFGAGRINEIAEACRAVGMKNPLFVTDRGLATTDIAQKTLDLLEADSLGRAVFADVDPNPNEKINKVSIVKVTNTVCHPWAKMVHV